MASVLVSQDGDLRGAESALTLEVVLRGEVESDVSDGASDEVIFIRRVGYDRRPDICKLATGMTRRL